MSLKLSLKRTALSLAIAVAGLVGTATVASAASAYATANVNVRSGAGTGYGVVGVLQRGEMVDIDYCRGSWCRVIRSGPDGWVSASYLARDRYRDRYDDDDYYYDDDEDFYIVPHRPVVRPWPYRPYRPYYGSSACIGGPNASFCISN